MSYSYYNITWMGRYRKNNKIYLRSEIMPFFGIALLITEINWILLMQVKEIISSFGS